MIEDEKKAKKDRKICKIGYEKEKQKCKSEFQKVMNSVDEITSYQS